MKKKLISTLFIAGLMTAGIAPATAQAAPQESVKQMQPLDKKLGGGVSTSGRDWFDRSCVRIWPWQKCPKR